MGAEPARVICRPEFLYVFLPPLRPIRSHIVRYLIHCNLVDSRKPGCRGLQRKRTTRRYAVQTRRSSARFDERFDVVDLAFDGVRQGVAALASAASGAVLCALQLTNIGDSSNIFVYTNMN